MLNSKWFRGLWVVALLVWGMARASAAPPDAGKLKPFFEPPGAYRDDFGSYKSPLTFDDGRPVRDAAQWRERRQEILKNWHALIGAWPPLIEKPQFVELRSEHVESFTQRTMRLEVAPDRTVEGYLLTPDGPGRFPAVLVVYYEPETAIGRGQPRRDFALQLARRGFVTLAIGFDPRVIDPNKSGPALQPLSYLAYVAANSENALASRPEVDRERIGVMGHSYGGKWALFAACLDERFACGVWSDPGIVFDEARANVNYWEPWYLGWEPGKTRKPGLITAENPRTGAYKRLIETGHDLHELLALMAPRPFLVSGGAEDTPERWRALNHVVAVNRLLGQSQRVAMTNRAGHDPTAESNEQIYQFLEYALKPRQDRSAEPSPLAGEGRVRGSSNGRSPLTPTLSREGRGGRISPEQNHRPPSILFLMPDQMRGQALGCMGDPDIRTPHLDRLASQGLLLRHMFANTPVCCPARAVILTGKYAHKNGMVANDLRLRETETTIAEILAAHGYRTGFIGKWHLDGGPRLPGFIPPGPRRQGFSFWAANECNHTHFRPVYFRDTAQPITENKFEPEVWTDRAIEFLEASRR